MKNTPRKTLSQMTAIIEKETGVKPVSLEPSDAPTTPPEVVTVAGYRLALVRPL